MTRDQKLEMITKTYEDALRNTHMRFVVYEDGETGEFYQFSDIAGGNSQPESAWNGKDRFVCEFCNQHWSPEDVDGDFRENLISYLDDEQKRQIDEKEREDECKLSGREIAEMFPKQYEEYGEDIIEDILSEFCPDDYVQD